MSTTYASEMPACDHDALVAALRRLRAQDGRSIRALAQAADLPSSTVGGFFSGRHLPRDLDTWHRLLSALGVDDEMVILRWAQTAREVGRRRRTRSADG